jgi:hypothetical protein
LKIARHFNAGFAPSNLQVPQGRPKRRPLSTATSR